MRHFTVKRLGYKHEPYNWKLSHAAGGEICVTRTQKSADYVESGLVEVKELRILLAWTSNALSTEQASAMLGYQKPVPDILKQRVATCLRKFAEEN